MNQVQLACKIVKHTSLSCLLFKQDVLVQKIRIFINFIPAIDRAMNMNYGCAVYVNTITDRSRELRVLKLNTITSQVVGWVFKNRSCLSSLHVSSLARFLDLTERELSPGVGVGHLEALVFLLWQSCKVGSGFSAAGISSTKCRLQTLDPC